MRNIEESTEILGLLNQTKEVEDRQKKRYSEIMALKEKEKETQHEIALMDVNKTCSQALDHEEAQRKILVQDMMQKSNPAVAPIVKIMAHNQGIFFVNINIYFFHYGAFLVFL